MAIMSRVETPRALSAEARRSMVGGSLTTAKPPLVSVTLVCVDGTTTVPGARPGTVVTARVVASEGVDLVAEAL